MEKKAMYKIVLLLLLAIFGSAQAVAKDVACRDVTMVFPSDYKGYGATVFFVGMMDGSELMSTKTLASCNDLRRATMRASEKQVVYENLDRGTGILLLAVAHDQDRRMIVRINIEDGKAMFQAPRESSGTAVFIMCRRDAREADVFQVFWGPRDSEINLETTDSVFTQYDAYEPGGSCERYAKRD